MNNINKDFLDNNSENVNINIENSFDELMNELLFRIQKNKENIKMNNINNVNNTYKASNKCFEKTKIIKENRNEYFGKLTINNKVFQNNPKMKELANLLKDYNQDKNEKDKIQIKFYNNNQINIVKPEVYFNIHNPKNKNIEYYNRNKERQFYISAIDGKAIINGKRININKQFPIEKNNINNKKEDNNDINNNILFDSINTKLMEKKNKLNNDNNDYENIFKLRNENDNKIKFKTLNEKYFFSKDYYIDELNKINNNLFNIDNNLNKFSKYLH